MQHSALLDLDNETAFFGVFDGHGGKHTNNDQCLLCSIVLDYSGWMQLCQLFVEPTFNIAQSHMDCFTQEEWLPNSVQNICMVKFSKVKPIQLVT
jgi:serine/threonine protein phosphatase PrpC